MALQLPQLWMQQRERRGSILMWQHAWKSMPGLLIPGRACSTPVLPRLDRLCRCKKSQAPFGTQINFGNLLPLFNYILRVRTQMLHDIMETVPKIMKTFCAFLLIFYFVQKGSTACTDTLDTLCSRCLDKQCTEDTCTCVDGNGSGTETCIIDDFCLRPGSSCCPEQLTFNNDTKCCDAPRTSNSPKIYLHNKVLFGIFVIWKLLW